MKTFISLQENEILEAIDNSIYIAHVFKYLDCQDNGYNRERLKEFMEAHNIPESKFKKKITREYYQEHPKYCKNCGKELPFEKRENDFCDRSCSTSYNNKGIIRNPSGINGDGKEHIIKEKHTHCLQCGKPLSKTASKFCNNECKSRYYYEQYIERWKQGLEDGKSGKYDVSENIRRYLFEKYNSSCQECGWNIVNKYTNKVPLQIHHIDGDCTNNKEENLQLLCPNCHSLTENYGSRNENATRIDNRQRY